MPRLDVDGTDASLSHDVEHLHHTSVRGAFIGRNSDGRKGQQERRTSHSRAQRINVARSVIEEERTIRTDLDDDGARVRGNKLGGVGGRL